MLIYLGRSLGLSAITPTLEPAPLQIWCELFFPDEEQQIIELIRTLGKPSSKSCAKMGTSGISLSSEMSCKPHSPTAAGATLGQPLRAPPSFVSDGSSAFEMLVPPRPAAFSTVSERTECASMRLSVDAPGLIGARSVATPSAREGPSAADLEARLAGVEQQLGELTHLLRRQLAQQLQRDSVAEHPADQTSGLRLFGEAGRGEADAPSSMRSNASAGTSGSADARLRNASTLVTDNI